MGTVATSPPPPPPRGPSSESLPHIDIRKLSQSELYALSTCSDFAFDLHRTDDVVSPNIDRANFNESAGSRRQTYSLHRDSTHHHHHHHHHHHLHHRRTSLLSVPKHPPSSDHEDRSILHFLKHYLNHNSTSTVPPPPPPPPAVVTGDRRRQLALAVHVADKKRKRIQKMGIPEKGVKLQRVNKEGQEVDFTALESNGDELYTAELRRRTMGLRTEDELLVFLRGLEGQWGSTRKRRKYVDASELGSALPVGWKLLLGLKRRTGSVWVYCRAIVSPTGEQFLSCKEVASFLRSSFEAEGSNQLMVHLVERAGANQKNDLLENGEGVELQRVNKNNQEVDLTVLKSNGDELYASELQRRTIGLQTEEEFLEFLRGLEGRWGSARKRRKYVDASGFGDVLPVGWKLLLGLRRRDGFVRVYSHAIVSPTGEQFLSCKEAASFLRSYFEAKGSKELVDRQICLAEQADAMVSGNGADFVAHADNCSGLAPSSSLVPAADGKDVDLADLDNLPEVQVHDLYECYKCNLAFDKKNAYLQHLMSFHQQTTRRFKFGRTVHEGLIAEEGTYECQFCNKVFREKNDYDGHVAVHSGKQTGGSGAKLAPDDIQKIRETPSKDVLHSRSSEIKNSTEISLNDMVTGPSTGHDSAAFTMMNSEDTLDKVKRDGTCNKGVSQHGNECILADGKTNDADGRGTFETNQIEICLPVTGLYDSKEFEGHREDDIGKGSGCRSSVLSVDAANKGLAIDQNMLPTGNMSSPVSLAQPLECLSSLSNKGGNEFYVDSQKLRNLTGFEELALDEMEYDFVDGNRGRDFQGVSMNLLCDTAPGQETISLVGSDTKAAQVNTTVVQEFTTVCVWCRSEFQLEAFEPEVQLDSIGYMCTICKDNISGHFNRICS